MSQITPSDESHQRPEQVLAERRQYSDPPIQEALCEIRLAPADEWSIDVPTRLQAALSPRYDGSAKQEVGSALQIRPAAGAAGVLLPQSQTRLRFFNLDESRLVTITPTSLTIHILSPYRGWGEFKGAIAEALDAYSSVLSPEGIEQIEVRYINRVVVEAEEFRLGEYFTAPPSLPASLPVGITDFLLRVESVYEDCPARLVQIFASAEAAEGSAAVILDLNVVRSWDKSPLKMGDAMGYVEDLRSREREAFEALITNEAREMFGVID